jgi:hypothetical protein
MAEECVENGEGPSCPSTQGTSSVTCGFLNECSVRTVSKRGSRVRGVYVHRWQTTRSWPTGWGWWDSVGGWAASGSSSACSSCSKSVEWSSTRY